LRLLPYALRHATAHPGRTLIQVLAIAAGVSLGYAVHLINASALAEFAAAERSLSGTADFSVIGPAAGFDESWYRRIALDPSVAAAAPLLDLDVTIAAPPAPTTDRAAAAPGAARPLALHVVGIDALRSAWIEPDLVGVPAAPEAAGLQALLGAGLYLSPLAQAQLRVAPGATLELVVGARRVPLRIAGSLPAAHEALASMDLGYAQWRLDRLGRLSRIDVVLAPGADLATVVRAWGLPANLRIERRAVAIERQQGLSRAYRVNLDVLSMVALFTGGFLVYSLQSQSIVVRGAQLALLRMLGATRGRILGMLLAESLALGAAGALLGLAAGAALAQAALRSLGGDLGGGYFAGLQPHISVDAAVAGGFLLLGLAAATAGAWFPARAAAALAPAPALRSGIDSDDAAPGSGAWRAVVPLVLALLLVLLPPVQGIAIGAYAAIALLLVATIAAKPLLAPFCFVPLARWMTRSRWAARYPAAWLATTRLARRPRFAAVGAAGILASFALMVAMATMVHSFRGSFDAWLGQMLAADLYVRAAPAGTTGSFSAADLRRLREDPDVRRAEFARTLPLALDAQRAPVLLLARAIDRARPQDRLPLVGAAPFVPPPAVPVWLSEAAALLLKLEPGQDWTLPLPTPGGDLHPVAVRVAGIWRDYARQSGSIVIDIADYERLTGDATRSEAALWLRPGASAGATAQHLLAALEAPAAQIAQPAQIRTVSLRLFDRSFQVTYLLEWAAIGIGLVGLATTFAAQAAARSREFGMLRHLGVTRRQVLAVLVAEASLVTALAVALGLAAGLAIAWVLVAVVNPQSFHWTMELRLPYGRLAALTLLLLAAAALTSIFAGRRALSIEAVRSVKDDW